MEKPRCYCSAQPKDVKQKMLQRRMLKHEFQRPPYRDWRYCPDAMA